MEKVGQGGVPGWNPHPEGWREPMGCCREGSGSLDKWDVVEAQQRKINAQGGVWLGGHL